MWKAFCQLILIKILGWKILGEENIRVKKCVIVVAPHTSYWDFAIGILVRPIVSLNARFLIKSELFKNPWIGKFLKSTGGIPVERKKKKTGIVQQAIVAFHENEQMCLAITPEGTRATVEEWKKGFYRIAKGAKVPIVLCAFDFGNKAVNFIEMFEPTDDLDQDIAYIKSKFVGVKGKNPALGVQATTPASV